MSPIVRAEPSQSLIRQLTPSKNSYCRTRSTIYASLRDKSLCRQLIWDSVSIIDTTTESYLRLFLFALVSTVMAYLYTTLCRQFYQHERIVLNTSNSSVRYHWSPNLSSFSILSSRYLYVANLRNKMSHSIDTGDTTSTQVSEPKSKFCLEMVLLDQSLLGKIYVTNMDDNTVSGLIRQIILKDYFEGGW